MANAFDYRISSGYGKRNIGGGFHHGVDYACPEKTQVLAPCDFEVYGARKTTAGGYELVGHVNLDGENFYLHFIHLREMPLGDVRTVKRGDFIAVSGQTGTGAKGAHLHFEVNHKVDQLGYGLSNTVGSVDPKEFFEKYAIIEKRKERKKAMRQVFKLPDYDDYIVNDYASGLIYRTNKHAGELIADADKFAITYWDADKYFQTTFPVLKFKLGWTDFEDAYRKFRDVMDSGDAIIF